MARFQSVNPADGECFAEHPQWGDEQIENALNRSTAARRRWAERPHDARAAALLRVSQVLSNRKKPLARLITREMGKLTSEAEAEIEKCAWVCRYYAETAAEVLADRIVESDSSRSMILFEPIGTVLAIMPWNFPFWQAMRCAVPAVAAGNSVLLKHASGVMGCAIEIQRVFEEAGLQDGVFQSMLIDAGQAARVVEDDRVRAVSLTGSEAAGRSVAASAGRHLTRLVLELGGSDPFIVLEDADLDQAADAAAVARFMNCGQSCIAAKRFIVATAVAEEFTTRFVALAQAREPGDPSHDDTTLAPMARHDLRQTLHEQIERSIEAGARLRCGGQPIEGPGYFYQPTVLDRVPARSAAATEEVFGPAAAVMSVDDEESALALANASRYGLGASVWSSDLERAERLARRLECGNVFVNSIVRSDPRLPFGGVKDSGYGRELAAIGLRELTSVKTLCVD